MSFVANRGQDAGPVKFMAGGGGYRVAFTPAGPSIHLSAKERASGAKAATGSLKTGAICVKAVGGNPAPRISGVDPLPGKTNYLLGNDSSKWITNVPTYRRVKYADVYPGVDLLYYGNQDKLEYDVVVAPGADASAVALEFAGANDLHVDAEGALVIGMDGGAVRQLKPVVYQEVSGVRRPVAASYELRKSANSELPRVAFNIGAYDHDKTLVIDPIQIIYSTYLGSASDDRALAIATDGAGNAYVTGLTSSVAFPTTVGAYKTARQGTVSAFVTKFNPAGNAIIYSTYLGGTTSTNEAHAIRADSTGKAYIAGQTSCTNFPTTGGCVQSVRRFAPDGFVTVLNAAGDGLAYSTYFGGSDGDDITGLAYDATTGRVAITGSTASLPQSPYGSGTFLIKNAYQTSLNTNNATHGVKYDAYVAMINPQTSASSPDNSRLIYSSYIGGTENDYSNGVTIGPSGSATVIGYTVSASGFPISANAYQSAKAGAAGTEDVFVTRFDLNASGASSFKYGTYLGGSGTDRANGVGVDDNGYIYVAGSTNSGLGGTTPFPTKNAILPTYRGGLQDAFAASIDPGAGTGAASLRYSTYLGGDGDDQAFSMRSDRIGNAYILGRTGSSAAGPFPQVSNAPIQTGSGGTTDMFITKLRPDGTGPVFSTYYGGVNPEYANSIFVDDDGAAFFAGQTSSASGVKLVNPYQSVYGGGGWDAYIGKIQLNDPPEITTDCPDSEALGCDTLGGETFNWSIDVSDINGDNLRVDWLRSTDGGAHFTVVHTNDISGPPIVLDPVTVTATVTATTGTATYSPTVGVGSYIYQVRVTDGLKFTPIIPADCQWSIDIVDANAPNFTGATSSVLPDREVSPTDGGCTQFTGDLPVPAITDCDPTTTLSATRSDGGTIIVTGTLGGGFTATIPGSSPITVGSPVTITWTATDSVAGPGDPALSSIAMETITVVDIAPPTLTIPDDVTVPADSAYGATLTAFQLGIVDALDNPLYSADDTCGGAFVVAFRDNSWNPGDGDDDDGIPENLDGPYPLGRSMITWLAIDDNFNYVELQQKVYVEGTSTVSSTFGTDADSWTSTGVDVTAVSYASGSISASQPNASGLFWYFEAPTKFRGNMQGAYDQTLTFDLKLNAAADVSSNQGVILSGGGLILYHSLSSTPTTSWGGQSVTFNAAAGWLIDNGDGDYTNDGPASSGQIQQALGSVASLKIRGKFTSSAGASTALDNVVLHLNYTNP